MFHSFSTSSVLRSVTALVTSILIQGCGKAGDKAALRAAVAAPADITDSFSVTQDDGVPIITLRKSALDKEFLLQASLIEQPVAAMGSGTKSRVVAFKRHGQSLFLLETNDGHTVTRDLPQTLVLTSFPILRETDRVVEFDFNKGMADLFVTGDWYAQDIGGRQYSSGNVTVHTRHSYIDRVEVGPANRLQINQIAAVEFPGYGRTTVSSVEVRYYISPYSPDNSYRPVVSTDLRRHGFFEVAPQLAEDGSTTLYATRFHQDKPITFAISANTPPEFKQAVRDGIGYWRSLFTPGHFRVVEAPQGVTAPDPNYHIVQWVPYDRAGMAYADAQMDPRTGQVLHGQIYLTSAFAFIGRAEARKAIARAKRSTEPKARATHLGLQGFAASKMCQLDINQAMASVPDGALARASDPKILRAAQDFVRSVTAHEVGHVLGLRHNFAGSLSVHNYNLADRRTRFFEYLDGAELAENVIPSSSVMDYLAFEEDVFVGSRIRRGFPVLEYDAKAVAALYRSDKFNRNEIPLFCTDSQVGSYVDCQRFDAGASLVEYSALKSSWAVADLPYYLIESYIDLIAPLKGDPIKSVDEVAFSPSDIASFLVGDKAEVVRGFGDSSRFLAIHNQYPYVSELNQEEVREKEFQFIADEVVRIGGLESVFSLVKKDYYDSTLTKVESLLRQGGYDRGIGLDGSEYQLSDADIQTILANTKKLLAKLPEALVKEDLFALSGIPNAWKLDVNPQSRKLATLLASRMDEYIFQVKDDVPLIEGGVEIPVVAMGKKAPEGEEPKHEKVQVKLPQYFYSIELRTKAAGLLKPADTEKGLSWGVLERNTIRNRFDTSVQQACGGCKLDKLTTSELVVPDSEQKHLIIKWFVENKRVLDGIGK